MNFIKPSPLSPGDTIAVVTPSWAGPSVFPHVFELGLQRLRETFNLKIKEFPLTRQNEEYLTDNPELRARDINNAFADPDVKAIIASIGGDDSINILPFLDLPTIINNPKILMGYSDTTTLLTYLNQHGLVTFHGPSVMSGFAEPGSLPDELVSHIKSILFTTNNHYVYHPYKRWTQEFVPWESESSFKNPRRFYPNNGWKVVNGSGSFTGRLYGGCLETLEMMQSTKFWPSESFWVDKVLFLETSEEQPPIAKILEIMEDFGNHGILSSVSGLLIGRFKGYSHTEQIEILDKVKQIISNKFNRPHLPIIADLDFGHTEPQLILPLGVTCQFDIENMSFALTEPWLMDYRKHL